MEEGERERFNASTDYRHEVRSKALKVWVSASRKTGKEGAGGGGEKMWRTEAITRGEGKEEGYSLRRLKLERLE